MTDAVRWRAVLENDETYDGTFYYAVSSTGIFCRPSCVSRPPQRKNVQFFNTASAAMSAGFRPCKRCRPDLADYAPEQALCLQIKMLLETHFTDPLCLDVVFSSLGLSRRRMEEIFRRAEGDTIAGFLERLRLERAKELLRQDMMPVSQVAFDAGFGSLSAFYRQFRAVAGCTPLQYRKQEDVT